MRDDPAPSNPACEDIAEERGHPRVLGLECLVKVVSVDGQSATQVRIADESQGGMGLFYSDHQQLPDSTHLVVSDFDGEHLGIVRHISPCEGGYQVGVQWTPATESPANWT